MKKKILFPTDFSDTAETAFQYARCLAKDLNAEITVLNVFRPGFSVANSSISALQVIDAKKTTASKQLKRFVQNYPNHQRGKEPVQCQASEKLKAVMGFPAETICQVANEGEFDLIVMGTQGEHTRLDRLLGSVAANVIKSAPCSVLVVPQHNEYKTLKDIVYATENIQAEHVPFQIAKDIAGFFEANLHCVHVNKGGDYAVISMEKGTMFRLDGTRLDITFDEVKDTSIETGLTHYIENENIDMLVMYGPHKGLFDKFFRGSHTSKMAMESRIPLLVFREKLAIFS